MAKDGEAATKAPRSNTTAKTCFVMMPISDVEGYPIGHFAEVYKQLIEPAVRGAGYECSLATSTNSAHLIQLDVVTKVATADLCICDMSTNNPNVLFEYGIRQAFDKPTVLVRDNITSRIFDVNGFRDITYDHTLRIANILSARGHITKAIEETIEGSANGGQIFSLVKLMQLTKAAIPASDLSPDDARFALLERKLDAISHMVSASRTPGNSGKKVIPAFRSGKGTVLFHDDHIELRPGDGAVYIHRDITSLEKTKFWAELSPMVRKEIEAMIAVHSPEFIPF